MVWILFDSNKRPLFYGTLSLYTWDVSIFKYNTTKLANFFDSYRIRIKNHSLVII